MDFTKVTRTKSGREFRYWFTDSKGELPVKGAFRSANGQWVMGTWSTKGKWGTPGSSDYDLVSPEPEKFRLERWANVYRKSDGEVYLGGGNYATETVAQQASMSSPYQCLGQYKIVIEGEVPSE